MFGLGWGEILVIVFVILILFGGWSKLPQLGESIGKGIKGFQKAMKGEPDKEDKPKGPENKAN
jgi:sec-independent protein translocase protein TatA